MLPCRNLSERSIFSLPGLSRSLGYLLCSKAEFTGVSPIALKHRKGQIKC